MAHIIQLNLVERWNKYIEQVEAGKDKPKPVKEGELVPFMTLELKWVEGWANSNYSINYLF